jgi:hypothetical protein
VRSRIYSDLTPRQKATCAPNAGTDKTNAEQLMARVSQHWLSLSAPAILTVIGLFACNCDIGHD